MEVFKSKHEKKQAVRCALNGLTYHHSIFDFDLIFVIITILTCLFLLDP